MIEDEIHTPAKIAHDLYITTRRVQQICKKLFKRKGHYRLTDSERVRVVQYHLRWKKKQSPRKI